jgi:hypothetical protein
MTAGQIIKVPDTADIFSEWMIFGVIVTTSESEKPRADITERIGAF